MPNFRKIINSSLKKRGWSVYKLSQESGIAYETVRGYLAGDHDITAAKLEAVLTAIDGN